MGGSLSIVFHTRPAIFGETDAGCKECAGEVDSHREPLLDYPLDTTDATVRGGCSIIGGSVYRGNAIPGLQGIYLYGDHCSPDIAAVRWCGGDPTLHRRVEGLGGRGEGLASFGEGPEGELYLVYAESGEVKRIASD